MYVTITVHTIPWPVQAVARVRDVAPLAQSGANAYPPRATDGVPQIQQGLLTGRDARGGVRSQVVGEVNMGGEGLGMCVLLSQSPKVFWSLNPKSPRTNCDTPTKDTS